MRIFVSTKFHEDMCNRQQLEHLLALLAQCGVETFCVVKDIEAWGAVKLDERALMQATLDVLQASDMLLVDLTEKGVGIGIEAGFAYARGIPVWVVAPAGREVSATLRGIANGWLNYANEGDLKRFLRGIIENRARS